MSEWYYTNSGQRVGPVSGDHLRQLIGTGTLQASELVWRQGMPNWAAVSSVPELHGGAAVAAAPAQPAYAQPGYAQPASSLSYASPMDGPALMPRGLMMLKATKPWVRFLSVMCFIAVGLCAIGGLGELVLGMNASPYRATFFEVQGAMMFGGAVLYIFPGLFLNRYASRIGSLLASRRSSDLDAALEAQKSFWKFAGILTLVLICIYGVMLLLIIARAMRML